VALGVTLALLYLRGQRRPPVGIVHGVAGAIGLCLLLIALQGPRRGDAMGAGSFGMAAAVLFGIAFAIGPFILLLNRRAPRFAGLTIASHASVAITAFVLLLAWVSFG
jgi:hypothetical protein